MRLSVIGDLSRLDSGLKEGIENVVNKTKDNRKIVLTIGLNYGGRDEIIRAIHKMSDPKIITETSFSQLLDTNNIPDPDLIIRTGGEQRLSGFLPWQSVYSELYFPQWYMPDFTPERLDEAIEEYEKRQRRFGK